MKRVFKALFLSLRPAIDAVLSVVAIPAGLALLLYRRIGSRRLPITSGLLKRIGIFPIRNHYYEPLFDDRQLLTSLNTPRALPGIDFNVQNQLDLLQRMTFTSEFKEWFQRQANGPRESFRFNNAGFESGDAEFLFQAVRHFRPNKIIEIGSGSSTKIARKALSLNAQDDGIRLSRMSSLGWKPSVKSSL